MTRPTYKLGTAIWNGNFHPIVQLDNTLHSLAQITGKCGPDALLNIIRDWDGERVRIERAIASGDPGLREIPAPEAALQTPLLYPAKVICAGANYYDHVAEVGIENIDDRMKAPYFFFKPPTTTLVGPGQTVEYPVGSKAFDWEIELAVIIGREAKGVAPADALETVAGYALAIDLTARDLQLTGPDFFSIDWYAGKAQDTSCPLGPFMTPAHLIDDPQNLTLELQLNGTVRQRASTAGMIFTTAELIATASQYVTLEPGDIVLTGSPAGVGHVTRTYNHRGDRLVAATPELGLLDVEVRR